MPLHAAIHSVAGHRGNSSPAQTDQRTVILGSVCQRCWHQPPTVRKQTHKQEEDERQITADTEPAGTMRNRSIAGCASAQLRRLRVSPARCTVSRASLRRLFLFAVLPALSLLVACLLSVCSPGECVARLRARQRRCDAMRCGGHRDRSTPATTEEGARMG